MDTQEYLSIALRELKNSLKNAGLKNRICWFCLRDLYLRRNEFMKKIKIAVSQFPVSTDIRKNESYITKHIINASRQYADVIHFPETSLSGYETKVDNFNWSLLGKSIKRIRDLAKQHKIYIVLGSWQKRKQGKKPYNCTILISKYGQIIGAYKKANLYGKEKDRFSSKNNYLIKEVSDVKCGFLICYDSCFPKLFEFYRNQDVKVLFLSYYNAKSKHNKNSMDDLTKAQLRSRAADNLMYISASNSSARYSRMPSGVASPDGELISLKRHKTGLLIYDYPKKALGWTYDNNNK